MLTEEAELTARVAVLPAGEDPDSYLRRHGAAAFDHLLAAALPMFEYRVELAARRHDPGTREGRIALIDEVLSVIQSVANPVRAAEYVRALAERFGLPEDVLRQRLRTRKRSGPARTAETPAPVLQSDRAREGAERLLLHLMVQEPERRAVIGRSLGPESFSSPVHRALATALFGAPEAGVGELREGLEDAPAALLMRLAFETPPVTDAAKARAADDAARYLTHTEPVAAERRRVWEAIQAAQASGNEEELRRLQAAYAELFVSGKRSR
jgi:DNA primase